MTESHAQQASITRPTIEPQERNREREANLQSEPRDPHDGSNDRDREDPAAGAAEREDLREESESEVGRIMRESQEQRNREQDCGIDQDIEL